MSISEGVGNPSWYVSHLRSSNISLLALIRSIVINLL